MLKLAILLSAVCFVSAANDSFQSGNLETTENATQRHDMVLEKALIESVTRTLDQINAAVAELSDVVGNIDIRECLILSDDLTNAANDAIAEILACDDYQATAASVTVDYVDEGANEHDQQRTSAIPCLSDGDFVTFNQMSSTVFDKIKDCAYRKIDEDRNNTLREKKYKYLKLHSLH